MPAHEPTRTRRHPTTAQGPPDERHSFFGRRDFDLSRDLLCVLRFDGTILEANRALAAALRYDRDELVGHSFADCIHRDDLARTREEARKLAAGGYRTWRFENRCRTSAGEWIWLEWTALASVVEGLIYASARDVSARKRREAELERAAHVDPLTGLANRRGFERALEHQFATGQRHAMSPGLLIVDLDGFKAINDQHGHSAGDDLLVAMADTLQGTLRASDLAARIGGDEFAVLLPDCDLGTAEIVAEKIVASLRSRQVETHEGPVTVSASAGAAMVGQGGVTTSQELVAAADRAMYRAKRRGSAFAIHDGE